MLRKGVRRGRMDHLDRRPGTPDLAPTAAAPDAGALDHTPASPRCDSGGNAGDHDGDYVEQPIEDVEEGPEGGGAGSGEDRGAPAARDVDAEAGGNAMRPPRRTLDLTAREGPPITPAELADACGIGVDYVREDIRVGFLHAQTIGHPDAKKREYRIPWQNARMYAHNLGVDLSRPRPSGE
jgi:hypothetical protein